MQIIFEKFFGYQEFMKYFEQYFEFFKYVTCANFIKNQNTSIKNFAEFNLMDLKLKIDSFWHVHFSWSLFVLCTGTCQMFCILGTPQIYLRLISTKTYFMKIWFLFLIFNVFILYASIYSFILFTSDYTQYFYYHK